MAGGVAVGDGSNVHYLGENLFVSGRGFYFFGRRGTENSGLNSNRT